MTTSSQNHFVSEQIVLVCIPVVTAKKHRESLFLKKSELRWNTSLSAKNEKVSHSTKKNNEKFSSSIKMTNINTEEIFSVHSTSFFLLRRNTARTHPWPTPTPKRKRIRSRKWLFEHCCLVFDRYDAKHQLTFPDFTSAILEHPDYRRHQKVKDKKAIRFLLVWILRPVWLLD